MSSFPIILLALLFLTNPPLLRSAVPEKPICPGTSFFKCGKLSNLQYPFTSSSFPKCGLFSVSGCNETIQKIQLGKRWYEIELISQSGSVLINDPTLKTLLSSRSCDYFDEMTDLSLASYPFVSLEILENRTVFKCDRTVRVVGGEGVVSVGCGGYVFYYGGEGFEGRCSEVRVPVNGSGGGLFGMLSGKFYVQASVSLECWKCVDGGGRCESDGKGRLKCTTVKAKTWLRLHSKLLVLAISAGGIGTLLTILSLIYRLRHTTSIFLSFWKRNRGKDDEKIESLLRACGPLCQKRYSYFEIKKMTESFKDKLGEGGFGGVYKGNLPDGHSVAVKVLKGSRGNGEEFINEVSSISKTSHVNIVSLLGFCFEGQRRALVYEFMANGSLEKFIYKESSVGVSVNRALEWEALFKIVVGIARGLEYLHLGCNTRILHFDIKPHNILLDEEFCPKISDFGLAKVCPRKESIISMLGARGTAGYIAPELVCRNIGGVSHKSDVYSYGMMVLEMVGGRRNIDCEADNTSEIYFPHWIYNRVVSEKGFVRGGSVGLEEEDCVRKMVVVSLWCVQTEPSKRPSMSRVVEMLEGRVGSLEDPPKPF